MQRGKGHSRQRECSSQPVSFQFEYSPGSIGTLRIMRRIVMYAYDYSQPIIVAIQPALITSSNGTKVPIIHIGPSVDNTAPWL
jgi:hypothetical protein